MAIGPAAGVLLLAALRTIPDALYRAAKMDGATAWETFRFVTLPAIKTTLIVVGVLQVIIGLQVFDLLYSLTSGGPGRDTYMLRSRSTPSRSNSQPRATRRPSPCSCS